MDTKELSIKIDSEMNKNSLFEIKSANIWIEEAKKRPRPKMLFGELWFENELCILFSDTNVGKSILAVQIGNSISKGRSTCGLNLEIEASKIIYFDFELSDKQFENRYSTNFKEHYNFDSNFLRAEINPEKFNPEKFKSEEDFLSDAIEKCVLEHKTKILIVDNITYLKNETEKAKDALPLMKMLNELKKKYNLSILVLAHTPKRDDSKPIRNTDISGSKMLINFCDSSFAIGKSCQDSSFRYIKQIKQRNVEEVYGGDNIILNEIKKVNSFLQFCFNSFSTEGEHLKAVNEYRDERDESILELKKQNLTNCDIARQIGISEGTVRNVLKKTM
ncbi:AAA family ATPase [Flavobacterium sp.]|jgi:RecA-family ATPase|uniref:AAA family ATPase n=1 Tax=Flavobacterium sp. TaxID=239 RepID=UPI002A817EE1|nr:AAA family ATPase [Flavobacterium sp.]